MFRERLKHHSHRFHDRLESHPRMVRYASGEASPTEYQTLLARLHTFWEQSEPATRELPENYHELLDTFREALRADAGLKSAAPGVATRYDEVGFFYVLLGSSHGARYMLRNFDPADGLPVRHLHVLAEQAHTLWTPFLRDYLERVAPARETTVMDAAARLFEQLYFQISA